MIKPPSRAAQLRMLGILRSRGMVLARWDHRILRYRELRRYVRAIPLVDARSGNPSTSRAWQITDAGIAAQFNLAAPNRRGAPAPPEVRQIDLEETIAARAVPETDRRPEATIRPVPDAPANPPADVSAPESRPSRSASTRSARGQQPETISL